MSVRKLYRGVYIALFTLSDMQFQLYISINKIQQNQKALKARPVIFIR